MADIEKIQEILTGYNSTLKNCVKKITENNEINKNVVEEIQNKIQQIKERVLQARNNVAEIGNQQTDFYKAMEQEKAKILKQQDERIGESKKEQERLQNELKDAQNASATTIKELQTKQENEIQKMKEKAHEEAGEAIRKQKEEDEAKLQMKMEELNKKMEDANSVAAENAAKIQKDAEEAKILAENERLAQEERLKELERQRNEILEKDAQDLNAAKEKINNLENHVKEMEQEIEKMKGEIVKQIEKNKTDKIEASQNLETQINEKIQTHKGEMEAQIKKATEDKEKYMEKALAEQTVAIQKAVEEVNKKNRLAQEEMTRATNEAQGNLQEQLTQCEQTKEAYLKEVADHLEKYKLLEQQFNESKNFALDDLKKLVEQLGKEEIASLEETIDEILGKKGPGGTGTGEPGRSPMKRMSSTDVALKDAKRTLEHSESFTSGKLTPQETIAQIDADTAAADERKRAKEARQKEKADRMKEREKRRAHHKQITQEASEEQEGFAKTTQKKQAWVASSELKIFEDDGERESAEAQLKTLATKVDYTGNKLTQDAQKKVKPILEQAISTFINNINTPNKFENLKTRVLENHGIHSDLKPQYIAKLNTLSKRKHVEHRTQYHHILNHMVSARAGASYKSIIESILKYGWENTFEQLLAAFHLIFNPIESHVIYEKQNGVVTKTNGGTSAVLALHIWENEEGRKVTARDLKNHLKKRGHTALEQGKDKLHVYYYHSHDKLGKVATAAVGTDRARKALQKKMSHEETAQAGGFRHGKRSQKKNKRTLKSKLTAKKYSLKVGKKKKGKRGNKSQKRRKSIKIRI